VTTVMDDAELAARFATGDADTVRVVYQTHGRLVFAIAYKVLGDSALAEEATQQTFVKAWSAAANYDPNRPLAAWLTTIARNVAIDVYRRERRHRHHADIGSVDLDLVTLPASVDQLQDVLEVREALTRLPDQDREMIRLQHYGELTHAEIAEQLSIPLGTVKSRSFRAHRRLAGLLGHLRTEPHDTRGSELS
jgi:RNA polymerase sigma factor (sigma-70 family)